MKTPGLKVWLVVLAAAALVSCGGTGTGNPEVSLAEDTSSSGAVAGAVGGALSSSSSNSSLTRLDLKNETLLARAYGRLVPDVWASGSCATVQSTANCSSSGGATMWVTLNDCQFGGKGAHWQGTQAFTLSSGTATCGTFPAPSGGGTLTLQYTNGATTTPGSMQVTNAYGTLGGIDDSTANLGNFDGDTITTIENGGYGTQVSFNSSGARTSVAIGHRLRVTGVLDQSVTGTVGITETAGAHTRTINGSLSVYHNGLQIVGTSVLNNVVHSDSCCLPISGSITTTFRAGAHVSPTRLGALAVNLSETLTFTGCGTAQLQTYDSKTVNVALTRCY